MGQSKVKDPDANVPETLRPVGCSFSVYFDPVDPDISTINFLMNTQASQGGLGGGIHSAYTPIFSSNWISPKDQCDGKMIYSSFSFLETCLINPIIQSLPRSILSQVSFSTSIPVDAGAVNTTKTISASGGYHYNVYDRTRPRSVSFGDIMETVTLTFDANWTPTSTGADLVLGGYLFVKQEKVTGDADAYSSVAITFTYTMSVNFSLVKGLPALNVTTPVYTLVKNDPENDANWEAKALGFFETMIALFSALAGNVDATEQFMKLALLDMGGFVVLNGPSIPTALLSLQNANSNAFMLPGSDTFLFKVCTTNIEEGACTAADNGQNFGIDSDGPAVLDLTYQTKTGNAISSEEAAHDCAHPKTTVDAKFITIEKPGSRLLALRDNSSGLLESTGTVDTPLGSASAAQESTSAALPLQDSFSLQSINSSAAPGTVDIDVSCELMTNSQTAMPVAPGADMQVVQDKSGRPLIFTIGSDKVLNVLSGVSGAENSGWITNDVLKGFPGYSTALAFDVVQDINGLISTAFVLQKSPTSAFDIYFCPLLSNDMSKTDWQNLALKSTLLQGVDANFRPDTIRLGSSNDGSRPMLTVEGSLNAKHMIYQLNVADNATIQEIEPPEDVPAGPQNYIQHTTGFYQGSRANYFLYMLDGSKRLMAETLLANGRRKTVNYSPNSSSYPDKFQNLTFNCMETAMARPGSSNTASDLYIGTANGGE